VGFLMHIQFPFAARTWAFTERCIEPVFHEPLPEPLDGGAGNVQRLGNIPVSGAFVRTQQHMGAGESAHGDGAFFDQVVEGLPLIIG
jgi:hypothetical protein